MLNSYRIPGMILKTHTVSSNSITIIRCSYSQYPHLSMKCDKCDKTMWQKEVKIDVEVYMINLGFERRHS